MAGAKKNERRKKKRKRRQKKAPRCPKCRRAMVRRADAWICPMHKESDVWAVVR